MPVIRDKRRHVKRVLDRWSKPFGLEEKRPALGVKGKPFWQKPKPKVLVDKNGQPLKPKVLIPSEAEVRKLTFKAKQKALASSPVLSEAQKALKRLSSLRPGERKKKRFQLLPKQGFSRKGF